MIEINHNNTISPWKIVRNGEEIPLTNDEALSLLQEACQIIGIQNEDLPKIIDAHKDIFFMIQACEEWYWYHPNQDSINQQLRTARNVICTLTDRLEPDPIEQAPPNLNLKRRRIQ